MGKSTLNKRFVFLAIIAILACTASVRAAGPVMVGDPKQPGKLAQAVQDAYAQGARKIVIRPGTYFLPDVGHTAITLDGWRDAAVSGYGATLILTDLHWMHDAVDLKNCAGVTLAGLTLSQNKITSYQGRIVAVGKDGDGKDYCDWKPDAGYPVPPEHEKGFLGGDVNVVDAQTRLFKVGAGDFYGVSYQALPGGLFRAQMKGGAAGDWLVGRYGDAPFKVYLNSCHGCTVRDVTLVRNGFAPLREENGGGNRYLHVVWALGPPPAGGKEAPLVTNSADGMHMTGAYPGPDIERCVFQGLFLDDCIAIHGYLQTVTAVNGPALTLKGGAGALKPGGPVRISDTKSFFGEATVTSIKDNGDGTTAVVLDKDLGVPPDAKLSNPLADGAGYKIIGCRLGNTRSRGILAKADSGLIQDNVIEGCGQAAISLGPEVGWGEADYVRDVTISRNVIRGSGRCAYGGGAILVHGDGARGNRDIVVQDNHFFADYQGDIDIQWADGVTLAGNVIAGAPFWPPGISRQSPVSLGHSRAVTLRANVVRNPGVYRPVLVLLGTDVTGLQGDDAAGIR